MRSIKLLFLFGMRRKCLRNGRSRLLYQSIKKGDKTDCSNYRGISLLPTMYRIISNVLLSKKKLLGIINVDFDATGHLLIIYSAFIKYLRKYGNTVKQ